MAFGKRFKIRFSDVNNVDDWEAIIYKQGYTGSVEEVVGAEDPVQVEWQAEEFKFSSIMAATAELNLIDETGNQFRELLDSNPKKFFLKITRGNDTYFIGINTPETYTEEFTGLPREVTLRFIDGLGYLKNIEYSPVNNNPERITAQDVIFNAKAQIEDFQPYGLLVYSGLFDSRASRANATDHPLDQHYVNEHNFSEGTKQQINSNGDLVSVEKFRSNYDALKEIAEAWAARVCFSYTPSGFYDLVFYSLNNQGSKINHDFVYVTGSPGNYSKTQIANVDNEAPIDKNSRVGVGGPENDPANIIMRDADQNLEFYPAKAKSIVNYSPNELNEGNIIERGNFTFIDFAHTQPQSEPGVYKLKDWTENNGASQFWDYQEGGFIVKSSSNSAYLESPSRSYTAKKLKFNIDAGAYFGPTTVGNYRNAIPDYQLQQINELTLKFRIEITDANNDTQYVIYDNTNDSFRLSNIADEIFLTAKKDNNFKRQEEFTITPNTETGTVKARIYGVENPTIVDSAGIAFQKDVKTEVFELSAKVEEGDVFKKRADNSTVNSNALSEPVEQSLAFSNNNPFVDAGAITVLDSGKHVQADQWNNFLSAYADGPLRHTKLIAREILKPFINYSRKFNGTITHGKARPFDLFTLEEYNGDIFGFLCYKYNHNLIENAVDVELSQTLYNLNLPAPTDGPTPIDTISTGAKNFPSLSVIGAGSPDSVTISDLNQLRGSGTQVVDLCSLAGNQSSATITLPAIEIATTVRLVVKCADCSSKTLIVNDANNNQIASFSCGAVVELIPSNTLGWVVAEI